MKFLVDMGISVATAHYLRALGYDTLHLRDQGLHKMEDPDILQKARVEERILLAHDLDFGDLLAASGDALPSVIIFRLQNMRPDNVNRHLKAVLGERAPELNQGVIAVVTEGRVRIRQLPIQGQE